MNKLDLPFNISLLNLDNEKGWTSVVAPVTSQDIFDGMTKNFHPRGLYSVDIFGTPGTTQRYTKESWIDIKVRVLHPAIYKALVSLKGLYGDIMAGRAFAVWDSVSSNFIESDSQDGQTGYSFFMTHFRSIEHEKTDSQQRQEKIDMVNKYKDDAMVDKVYVLPAGYRDVEIDDDGRVSSDEINALYTSMLSISNTISELVARNDVVAYDKQRMSLQNTFNELYQYAIDIIRGKNNLMMGKWAGRKVFDSTRNVLTAMDTTMADLGDVHAPHINDTMIGLLQFLKSVRPMALHHLKNGFLSSVFISPAAPATLTDTRTLKSVKVHVKSPTYDRWMSNEGLEKVINNYRESSMRSAPIMIEGRYLGLIYRGSDMTYRLLHGVDELPSGKELWSKDCTPITYNDLFYCSCYRWSGTIALLNTRYPIATDRSTYPARAYLMSTMKSERRVALDDQFTPIPEDVAPRFPITGSPTYDSLAPHASRLQDLGGDHDGDTGSAIAAMSEQSLQEISKLMNDKSFYIGPDGKLVADCNTSTIAYVVKNLTMDKEPS